MKLGILTFHRSINYGAYMQCYSLSQRLQRDFPELEIEVIDYTSPKAVRAEEKWRASVQDTEKKKKYEKRRELFADCCNKLPLSPQRLNCETTQELHAYLNQRYDIVVVGSDAVWNWNLRGLPNPYFLDGYRGVKLSYAASAHGQDFRAMTEEQKKYLAEAFTSFAYLGVRDVATEQMLHLVNPGLVPHHNCDPTMLLDISSLPCSADLVRCKIEQKGIDLSKPVVAIMAGENIAGQTMRKLFKEKTQTIALYEPNSCADVYMDDLDPFEWATSFSFCRASVTHFFHGTLLSLVNGIPPMATEPVQGFAANYTSKIRDVLTRLDLLDCYHPISMGTVSKLKRKLGLSADGSVWKGIVGDLQKVFPERERTYSIIRQKVEQEAKSYLDFKTALERCIKNLGTKE